MGSLFAALFFILLTFIDSFNHCRGQCEGNDVHLATYGPSADRKHYFCFLYLRQQPYFVVTILEDEVLNECEDGCQGNGFDRNFRQHIGNGQGTY